MQGINTRLTVALSIVAVWWLRSESVWIRRLQVVEDSSSSSSSPYLPALRATTNPHGVLLESLLDSIGTWDPDASNDQETSKIVWLKWNTHQLPLLVQGHVDEMKRSNPTYEFRLVNDTEAEALIRENFPPIFYEVYQSIHPNLGAARADFWRYCVLYRYGGVYMDLDAGLLKPLESWIVDDNAILSFEKTTWQPSCSKSGTKKCHCSGIWDTLGVEAFPKTLLAPDGIQRPIAQYAMVFPQPYHPILKETLLYMLLLFNRWDEDNIFLHSNFEMQSKILCITGPGMWTVAISRAFEKHDASYLKTRFSDNRGNGDLIEHPVRLIQRILDGQHKHYLNIGRSHPLLVGNGNTSQIEEGAYFQLASLPGLKKVTR
mmetsp:Transcript_26720/g.41104  ORF Transcript_26720/g.41104 Transcript_26720/m.41104 type:complete len:374 (-) Transcript_26720:363-1484(-)